MKDVVAAILGGSPGHRDALLALALAGPGAAWLGAGFVRNAVWDVLAGRLADVTALDDLDVVYLDRDGPGTEAGYAAALQAARPGLAWSVTNQGRMAARNGHPPYADFAEALAHWPETATAVAARLVAGRIAILAPHGLDDLMACVLRPTPVHASDPRAVRDRLARKGWLARWPALRTSGLD